MTLISRKIVRCHKELSHLSGVLVQICLLQHTKLILKCALEKVYVNEKIRTVEELQEEAD